MTLAEFTLNVASQHFFRPAARLQTDRNQTQPADCHRLLHTEPRSVNRQLVGCYYIIGFLYIRVSVLFYQLY